MDDTEILQLFASRDERALVETDAHYGRQCRALAARILGSTEAAEECVNDALLRLWNAIPPESPASLSAYFSATTRNLAINRFHSEMSPRRGGGQTPAVLDELAECIPAAETVESALDERSFLTLLQRFLDGLSPDARRIFVQRYWYMNTCRAIADAYGMSESKVRVTLMRTRKKFKAFLEKEEHI